MKSPCTLLFAGLIPMLPGACSSPTPAAAAAPLPQALPAGSHEVVDRTATVRLPYRGADGLLWVETQRGTDTAPFIFRILDMEPHAGPQGTDLAVFVYEADGPGSATLEFGLVPAGRTRVGPPGAPHLHEGPPAARYTAVVTAR